THEATVSRVARSLAGLGALWAALVCSVTGQAWGQSEGAREQAQATHKLARELYAKKDLDGAIAQFRKAIERDPTFAPAYSGLGVALRDKKDLKGAIAQFRKAIELDPRYAPAHSNLGLALRETRDLNGAIAQFRKAIELDPRFAPGHYNL